MKHESEGECWNRKISPRGLPKKPIIVCCDKYFKWMKMLSQSQPESSVYLLHCALQCALNWHFSRARLCYLLIFWHDVSELDRYIVFPLVGWLCTPQHFLHLSPPYCVERLSEISTRFLPTLTLIDMRLMSGKSKPFPHDNVDQSYCIATPKTLETVKTEEERECK